MSAVVAAPETAAPELASPTPPAPPDSPPPSRLRAQALAGVLWKFLSQGFRQFSRLIVALILARLLTPEEFGVAAEVLVISSLVTVFADLAFGAALIQRDEIDENDRSTAFWCCVGSGALFTGLGIALAGPIASFYHEPDVKPLLTVLSFQFVVTSLGTVQESLLTRELRFKVLETRQMVVTVGGAVVGIGAAAAGAGAWAIILQSLSLSVLSTILLCLISPWRPRFRFSTQSFRNAASFSGYIFGHRLLYYLHRNSDNLLIGRFAGAAQLGAYAIAYNVILVPFSRIASPIQDVLFPAFSRIQHEPERIASGWLRVTRAVAAVTVPMLVGLAIVADDFVHVVLGPKWADAATVIRVLAWVGILQSLQSLNTGILQALGRARTIFRYTVVFFFAHLIAFAVGVHWGIVGVAVGYAISTTIIEPSYLWLTARAAGISPWTFLESVAGVFEAGALMGVAVFAVQYGLTEATDLPAVLRLAVCSVSGALLYVPLIWWLSPRLIDDVRELRDRRRERVPAPASADAATV